MPRRIADIRISINVKHYNQKNDNYKLELLKLSDKTAYIRFNDINSKKVNNLTITEFCILFRKFLVKIWRTL